MERAFKGVWIPKEIWLDKELGWSEKLLLVEINSLDNDEGCWASNEYFAEFFGLSKGRISKLISGLKKKDYITVDFTYKKGTKEIDRRIVKINHRYRRKQLGGMKENDDRGIGENVEDNNTSFNNTSNNTLDKKNKPTRNVSDTDYESEFDQFWEVYPKKVDKKKSLEKFISYRKKSKNQVPISIIVQAVKKYSSTVKEKKYIKNPTTYINGENWNDEIEGGTKNETNRNGKVAGWDNNAGWDIGF